MEAGGASETDAKLKTFDDTTLRVAATAGAQVAYGHGAGQSLKSLGPYSFCPPDVQAAAAAMGITYGTVDKKLENYSACLRLSNIILNLTTSDCVPRLHVPERPRLVAFFATDNAC